MFPFTALRPLDSRPDLGKPHQTSELACVQFGEIPWCAGQHCVSPWPGLVVSVSHSLEPAPVAAPAQIRGVGLPETLSRSALGPSQFTHHILLLGKLA